MSTRRPTLSWLAVAALVALPSCAEAGASAPLPPTAPVVQVTAREYRFDYVAAIPKGRVVLELSNAGKKQHRLTVVPLPEGFPPVQEQYKSKVGRVVDPLATSTPLAPGGTTSFAVDLSPGRYAFICLIPEYGGVSHYRRGMVSEFRVR